MRFPSTNIRVVFTSLMSNNGHSGSASPKPAALALSQGLDNLQNSKATTPQATRGQHKVGSSIVYDSSNPPSPTGTIRSVESFRL